MNIPRRKLIDDYGIWGQNDSRQVGRALVIHTSDLGLIYDTALFPQALSVVFPEHQAISKQ